ncbi:glycine zipper 2TM domain-containing protein [Nitrogeniibacter mangrovi]|uniref:Glycine zipper 2TM domain-containing protein n=1 Tax=Nitrogeniibacter mangrovi TaxID=2016596 RepID=A0A6C1B200_9RHOO|nr:glycine zipper 2TM domain-containing protein [Nitrogeniibacter mangrovi]QID17009.1 glycine zipper 2TM domain-containing protein [Nitrogeniibacter mangrovi]
MVKHRSSVTFRAATLCAVAVLGLAGCASNLTGDTYSRDEARRAMVVRYATVESTRLVKLEGTKSNIGTVAGGAVGGIAGSSVGSGKGSAVGAVIGAVAGGIAGAAAEEGLTRSQGIEITVKLDNGSHMAIVQQYNGETFVPGQRVRLVQDGSTTRVTP